MHENVVFIYNGILFGHYKNEILSLEAKRMELEDIMLNERRQTQKDKHHMFSFMSES